MTLVGGCHGALLVKPAITLRGRKFNGLRGYAGKPFHPPLTDIPVAAYVLTAVFDVIAFIAGEGSSVGHSFFLAATYTLIAGAVVSLPTALTGFWDWLKSTRPGTQARRTANWHMTVMLTVTAIVLVDIALRLAAYDDGHTTVPVLVLSLVIGGLVSYGAAYGGALVYEYGFNVEAAGDHPAWHVSDVDVLPGDNLRQASTSQASNQTDRRTV